MLLTLAILLLQQGPNAPSDLQATNPKIPNSSRIDLKWVDSSSDESGFLVYRADGDASTTFKLIGAVTANKTLYSDTTVLAGKQYSYRVCAYNGTGNSAMTPDTDFSTTLTPIFTFTYGPYPDNIGCYYRALNSTGGGPLGVYFSGGGFNVSSKSLDFPLYDIFGTFLKNGIDVVSCGYRVVPDSASHSNDTGLMAPASHEDGVLAVQFLRYKAPTYQFDSSKIFTFGRSAGGGIAAWVALSPDRADPHASNPILKESSRVRCAVNLSGQTDWTKLAWTADQWNFKYFLIASTQANWDIYPLNKKQYISPAWQVPLASDNAFVGI